MSPPVHRALAGFKKPAPPSGGGLITRWDDCRLVNGDVNGRVAQGTNGGWVWSSQNYNTPNTFDVMTAATRMNRNSGNGAYESVFTDFGTDYINQLIGIRMANSQLGFGAYYTLRQADNQTSLGIESLGSSTWIVKNFGGSTSDIVNMGIGAMAPESTHWFRITESGGVHTFEWFINPAPGDPADFTRDVTGDLEGGMFTGSSVGLSARTSGGGTVARELHFYGATDPADLPTDFTIIP